MPAPSDDPARTLLARLVRDQHWTCDDFIRHYAATARSMPGVKATSISDRQAKRWLSGKITSRPFPEACRVLEKMFDCAIDDLMGAETIRHPRKPARTAPGGEPPPLPPRPTYQLLTRTTGPLTVPDQPSPGTHRGGGGSDPGLERQVRMSMRRAHRFLPLAEQSNVGPDTIEQIYDELRRLARARNTEPPSEIFPDLDGLQDLVFRLLEVPQRPGQSRDLYLLAAATSGMLADTTQELGHPHAAVAHGRVAYVCADNAGHEPLKMWVRGVQSNNAYWAGWTTDALRYCELSATIGPVAGTTSTWLPALEARAHAARGNADAATAAIRRIDEARDAVAADDVDGMMGTVFPHPRQLYYAAETYSRLPTLADAAEQAAQDAVNAYEATADAERAVGAENISRADLALARARSSDLDGTLDALRPVLDLDLDLRTDAIRQAVGRVHDALATPAFSGSVAARDLTAEIEHFDRISQPPVLPA